VCYWVIGKGKSLEIFMTSFNLDNGGPIIAGTPARKVPAVIIGGTHTRVIEYDLNHVGGGLPGVPIGQQWEELPEIDGVKIFHLVSRK
jgi:hypothetical protein